MVEEELLEHSPAAHVRRPRVDYESHAAALDRNELGALLVAAGLGPPTEHALISLLALNGLRVAEATGADIEHLDLERGHRTFTITRNGGKVVTIPLEPHTARAIDLVIGERTGAPVFLAADGAAAGPARHLHRRRLPTSQAPPGNGSTSWKAPPHDLDRRKGLPAAADPEHPAVTHRDLSANANRLIWAAGSSQPPIRQGAPIGSIWVLTLLGFGRVALQRIRVHGGRDRWNLAPGMRRRRCLTVVLSGWSFGDQQTGIIAPG